VWPDVKPEVGNISDRNNPTVNRQIGAAVLPTLTGIPTAIRAARGSAPNLTRGDSVPPIFIGLSPECLHLLEALF